VPDFYTWWIDADLGERMPDRRMFVRCSGRGSMLRTYLINQALFWPPKSNIFPDVPCQAKPGGYDCGHFVSKDVAQKGAQYCQDRMLSS